MHTGNTGNLTQDGDLGVDILSSDPSGLRCVGIDATTTWDLRTPSREPQIAQRTITFRGLECSTKLPVPILPETFLQVTGLPWTNYISNHLAFKREALPWLPDEKLRALAHADLEAMQLGFPAIDDEASALGLAACLTIVCYVDTFIEEMDSEMANQCVKNCLAILDGAGLDDQIARKPLGSLEKAQTICLAFRKQIVSIFHPPTAAAVIRDMKDMIAAQLLELDFTRGNLAIKTYRQYLDIRNRTFGLLPLLTIAEHHFLAQEGSLVTSPDINRLKNQISLMGIGQNDVGGLEKDIQLSNPSNSIRIFGMLLGRKRIVNANDLLNFRDILSLFEKQNKIFINDAIKTWSKVQTHSTVEGEKSLSNTLITLCVTHLKWVVSTSRYNIDSVLQGDCVGS